MSDFRRTKSVDQMLAWLRVHPDRWMHLLGRTPSTQQRQVLNDVAFDAHISEKYGRDHPDFVGQYAVSSGQGTGKTTMLNGIGCWNTTRDRMNRTVVTAPTMGTLQQGFFAELRIAKAKGAPILSHIFDFYQDRVRFFGEVGWELIGRTSSSEVALQGIHSQYLGVLVDEASEVDGPTLETFKGTLTNDYPLLFLAGNPNYNTGPFHDAVFTDRFKGEYRRYIFSSTGSPFANKERDRKLIEEYGPHSDVVRVRVYGLPPRGNRDAVLLVAWIEEAMAMGESAETLGYSSAAEIPLLDYPTPVQIGLDYARSLTGDESVISVRHNRKVWQETHMGVEPLALTARAFEIQNELGAANDDTLYVPDCDGLGAGVVGAFYGAGKQVYEFRTQNTPEDPTYMDSMTQAWFDVRNLIKDRPGGSGGGLLELPRDERLMEQLRARRFKLASGNRIQLESKKDHLDKHGYSPDRGDALAYSCMKINIASRYYMARSNDRPTLMVPNILQ